MPWPLNSSIILSPNASFPNFVSIIESPPNFEKAPHTLAGAPPTLGAKLSTFLIPNPDCSGIKSIRASPIAINLRFIIFHLS